METAYQAPWVGRWVYSADRAYRVRREEDIFIAEFDVLTVVAVRVADGKRKLLWHSTGNHPGERAEWDAIRLKDYAECVCELDWS